jgi:uncharacterized membrane protein YhaH (DUF805 family)
MAALDGLHLRRAFFFYWIPHLAVTVRRLHDTGPQRLVDVQAVSSSAFWAPSESASLAAMMGVASGSAFARAHADG